MPQFYPKPCLAKQGMDDPDARPWTAQTATLSGELYLALAAWIRAEAQWGVSQDISDRYPADLAAERYAALLQDRIAEEMEGIQARRAAREEQGG